METGKANEKKMMVAIDESECSHYALQWTLDNLSHNISNSKLILFSAVPLDDLGYVYASSFGAAPAELTRLLQQNQKKATLALLERAKEICANRGIEAETMTETGNPKVVICEEVEKQQIQLLVLGSRGRGVLKRAFMGSVSSYCVQHAKCPVLVVRKPQ